MGSIYPIHDLHIQPLSVELSESLTSLPVYAFTDHLLKRVGVVELIELPGGNDMPAFAHQKADELWILIAGEVTFYWRDVRENSPTQEATHDLEASTPVQVLVPFGVRFSVTARRDSSLIRISTQEDSFAELTGSQESRAR